MIELVISSTWLDPLFLCNFLLDTELVRSIQNQMWSYKCKGSCTLCNHLFKIFSVPHCDFLILVY